MKMASEFYSFEVKCVVVDAEPFRRHSLACISTLGLPKLALGTWNVREIALSGV